MVPPLRRQNRGSLTQENRRVAAVGLMKVGLTDKRIALTTGLTVSALEKIRRRFNKTGTVSRKVGSGRRKRLNKTMRKRAKELMADSNTATLRRATAILKVEFIGQLKSLSPETLRKALHEDGKRAVIPQEKKALAPDQMARRLTYAQNHVNDS